MPYNWALPLTMGYAFGGLAFGKLGAGKALTQMVHSAMEAFTPIGGGDNAANLMAPELLRTPLDLAVNEDQFGRPIHQDPDRQKAPNAYSGRPDYQGRVRTGQAWKSMAESGNDLSGGNPHKSGALDFYPEDYREIFNYIAGPQITLGSNIAATAGAIAQGQMPDPTHTPVVREFYGTDYPAAEGFKSYQRSQDNKHPWAR
jgi:hypothetical protein